LGRERVYVRGVIVRTTREFQGIRVLTADWPVVVIDFPEPRVPDSALRDCLFYLEDLLKGAMERGEKAYTITDISRMNEFPPVSQRKYAADWTSRTFPLQKAASLGGATVARGTMLRAFINAVHWIAPPAMPAVFVATRREAFAAAIDAFQAGHVHLGADVRAALAKRA
jgi:hypothetical protein